MDVRTNTDGATDITGSFGSIEERNLYKALHQALIVPTIERRFLDLSANADFQTGGKHIETDPAAGVNFIAYLDKSNHSVANATLYPDTKSLFLNDKDAAGNLKNAQYSEYFTLFKFGVESNFSGTLGAVEDIGVHNVMMFTLASGGDNCTLNHETLHGLGLCHTHRDEQPITTPGYKYVFPCAIPNPPYQAAGNPAQATGNIMSYQTDNPSGRSLTYYTWRWQWRIIN